MERLAMKKRFSVEQIVAVLKQAELGLSVADLTRRMGISEQTFCRWKKQYAGLETNQVREFKQLTDENARLKKLVAELSPEQSVPPRLCRTTAGQVEPVRCCRGPFHVAQASCGGVREEGRPAARDPWTNSCTVRPHGKSGKLPSSRGRYPCGDHVALGADDVRAALST
jgi:putative transposase